MNDKKTAEPKIYATVTYTSFEPPKPNEPIALDSMELAALASSAHRPQAAPAAQVTVPALKLPEGAAKETLRFKGGDQDNSRN